MTTTEVLRILVGTSVLAFASVTDLKWRRAPDACWYVAGAAALLLLGYDWWTTPGFWQTHLPALVVSGLLLVVAVLGYYTGLIGGGADAKAIMTLAVLVPLPLGLGWSPPLASPFPLVLTSLMNGLLVALCVPLFLAALNLSRGDVAGWHTFLGLKVDLSRLDARVLWPLEYIDEEGEHVRVYTPRGVPLDGFDPRAFQDRGIESVWVTPKVPFLVPLWIGLILAVLLGDPAAWAIDAVLG